MNQTLNKDDNNEDDIFAEKDTKKFVTSDEAKDEFYGELDQKKSHQSCCTCQTLILLFIVLLILLSGVIFFFYYRITRGGILQRGSYGQASISDLTEKLENISKDNNLNLIITSEELNTMLMGGLSVKDLAIKDINLSINTQEILIYGSLIKPLKSKVLISCIPVAENGKIVIRVTKMTAGSVTLPKIFYGRISSNLTALMDQKFEPVYRTFLINQVNLEPNQMVIKGISK